MYYNFFGYSFDFAMWMRIEIFHSHIYENICLKSIFQNIYEIVTIILWVELFYYYH